MTIKYIVGYNNVVDSNAKNKICVAKHELRKIKK